MCTSNLITIRRSRAKAQWRCIIMARSRRRASSWKWTSSSRPTTALSVWVRLHGRRDLKVWLAENLSRRPSPRRWRTTSRKHGLRRWTCISGRSAGEHGVRMGRLLPWPYRQYVGAQRPKSLRSPSSGPPPPPPPPFCFVPRARSLPKAREKSLKNCSSSLE